MTVKSKRSQELYLQIGLDLVRKRLLMYKKVIEFVARRIRELPHGNNIIITAVSGSATQAVWSAQK